MSAVGLVALFAVLQCAATSSAAPRTRTAEHGVVHRDHTGSGRQIDAVGGGEARPGGAPAVSEQLHLRHRSRFLPEWVDVPDVRGRAYFGPRPRISGST